MKGYILHITSWYPTALNKFDGDFIQRHIESLNGKVDQVVIHIQMDPSFKKGLDIQFMDQNGIETVVAFIPRKATWARPRLYWKTFQAVYREIEKKRGHPSIIHCHVAWMASMIGFKMKKSLGIPYVVTEHSTLYDSKRRLPFRRIKLLLSRKWLCLADRILPVSEDLSDKMKPHTGKIGHDVVPNVVPEYFFRDTRTESEHLRFIHVSSLDDKAKNISGMLRAFKGLLSTFPNIDITLIGCYHLEETKTMIDNMRLQDHVKLIGPLSHQEVASVLSEHDVFVLFSHFENLPCALLEAQASGLYILSTDVGGIREIVESTNEGLLVQRGDEEGLTDAIKEVLSGRQTWDSEALSRRAHEKYSNEIVARAFTNVYQTVLS